MIQYEGSSTMLTANAIAIYTKAIANLETKVSLLTTRLAALGGKDTHLEHELKVATKALESAKDIRSSLGYEEAV